MFQLLRVDVFVAEKVQDEVFPRSIEESRQQVRQRAPSSLKAIDDRRISERTTVLFVPDIAFALQDAKGGEDGVVGRTRRTVNPFDDFAHGGRRQIPEHLHDAMLGFGQAGRGFASHVGTIGLSVPVVN